MKAVEDNHDKAPSQSAQSQLPLEYFKDATQNQDGTITYRIPRHFRIFVDIEPLLPRYPSLGLHQLLELSDTAKDAIRSGTASIRDVDWLAKANYDREGPQVIECDLSTYLGDTSRIPENISLENQEGDRIKRRTAAISKTEHSTPFKLAIEIEWPPWCKEPARDELSKDNDEPITITQDTETDDGATPSEIPYQAPSGNSI